MAGWQICAVIVDADQRAVLVDGPGGPDSAPSLADAGSPSQPFRVPTVSLPRGTSPESTAPLDALEALLGRQVVPLWMRDVEVEREEQSGVMVVLAAGDVASDATAGRHFVEAAIAIEALEPAITRPVVRRWLESLDQPMDPRSGPWLSPDWYPRIAAWIADRLTAAGTAPTSAPRLFNQSAIGTVLRTQSGGVATFTKCPAPVFYREATITAALAERTPDLVPDLIAIEPEAGWLLMRDFGSQTLGGLLDAGRPPASLGDVARLQRAWIGGADVLAAAGAQIRPLASLVADLPGFVDDRRLADRVSPAVRETWPETARRLSEACQELQAIGIPEALIHGDLHAWNIAVADGRLRVFDWSDGAFGHPFLDLAVLLGRTDDLPTRLAMRDSYLDGWDGVAPRAKLEGAVDLAMAVGCAYQVVTYLQLGVGLAPEDAASYAGADVRWLGKAIFALDDGVTSNFTPGQPAG